MVDPKQGGQANHISKTNRVPQGRVGRAWYRVRHWLKLDELTPGVRRALVGVTGGTLLLVGIAMLVLPGPAFIVIPLGLALLGTEFAWARRSVEKARNLLKRAKSAATSD